MLESTRPSTEANASWRRAKQAHSVTSEISIIHYGSGLSRDAAFVDKWRGRVSYNRVTGCDP